MNWARFKLEIDSLRSTVARRIFLLFVLCAFVPLVTLAFFSLSQVSDHLEALAERDLQQLTKSVGMSVYERLLFLESELELAADSVAAAPAAGLRARDTLPEHHFRRIDVLPVSAALQSVEIPEPLRTPAGPAWAHLRSGRTFLYTGSKADVRMFRIVHVHGRGDLLAIGQVAPGYLFSAGVELPEGRSLWLVSASGETIFSSFEGSLPRAELGGAVAGSPVTGRFRFTWKGARFLASYWTIFMQPQFASQGWVVVGVQPLDGVLAPIVQFRRIFLLVALLAFLGILLLSFAQIRRTLIPVAQLKEATRRIGGGDLDGQVQIKSGDEFEQLGHSFNAMVDRIRHHLRVMETINSIGLSLSRSMDSRRILEGVLRGAQMIFNADGGALYVQQEEGELRPIFPEGAPPGPACHALAVRAAREGRAINVADLDAPGEGSDAATPVRHGEALERGPSVLTVPLVEGEETIGVIQLINARGKKHSGSVAAFTEEDEQLLGSLASQAAVACRKNGLIQDFKRLFESLINLIVTAIDEKSPHTGNHCKRVPILAMQLADAAIRSGRGKLKDFTLSEQELYELHVAALLHDCGKVTTPVHVMDKSTKLEKLFDRIVLVNTRFELVKAGLRQAFLEERLAARGSESEEEVHEANRRLADRIRQLNKDRDFLGTCNIGCEAMNPANAVRVREIAERYRWVNPDGEEVPILSTEEVYQLSVLNGTLTPEDREIVNYHIIATTRMLQELPYPKYLRNVPLYAGAHHERMDGGGYPQGLRGGEIPMQARILAVADIFEALTAEDRPYRHRATLKDALLTLREMAEQGQIDPDLVEVFIEKKVYLRYAEAHLDPEQIDEEFLTELEGLHP